MSVKKAISYIDFLIQGKLELKTTMIGSVMPPPISGDLVNRFDRAIGSYLERDIDSLNAIKRQLLPEQHRIKIVCSRPKKDHDTDGSGQKYCMNCNANL